MTVKSDAFPGTTGFAPAQNAAGATRPTAGGKTKFRAERDSVTPHDLLVVPRGTSEVIAWDDVDAVRLRRAGEPGWAERARNADSCGEPRPRVASLVPWPEPVESERLRHDVLVGAARALVERAGGGHR